MHVYHRHSEVKLSLPLFSGESFPLIVPAMMVFGACWLATHINYLCTMHWYIHTYLAVMSGLLAHIIWQLVYSSIKLVIPNLQPSYHLVAVKTQQVPPHCLLLSSCFIVLIV